MAFVAKDGSKHTNIDTMKQSNARTAAAAPPPDQGGQGDQGDQGGPPPIEQDPEAMHCVQILQSKGYTAQDVEEAMGGTEQPGAQGEPEGY